MVDLLVELFDGLEPQQARQALTHSSWAERRTDSYERLAFLGDSVLSLALSTDFYPRFGAAMAGQLTKIRAQAVSGRACAIVALELEVPRRLAEAAPDASKAAPAELVSSERVLASICEAMIGACYLQYGFERTAAAVVEAFADQVEDALDRPVDFKSDLQERLARGGGKLVYLTLSESGPAHERVFECAVEIRGDRYGTGTGRSKKDAEQAAAAAAVERLDTEAMAATESTNEIEDD